MTQLEKQNLPDLISLTEIRQNLPVGNYSLTIPSLNTHFLRASLAIGPFLGSGSKIVNKTGKFSVFMRLYYSRRDK